MANYTLCLLVKAGVTEEERNKFLQDLSKTINSDSKIQTTSWGKRDLAYPVKGETQAYYYLLDFETETTIPQILDKKLKVDENILRFLVIREKKPKKLRIDEIEQKPTEKEVVDKPKTQRKTQAKKTSTKSTAMKLTKTKKK